MSSIISKINMEQYHVDYRFPSLKYQLRFPSSNGLSWSTKELQCLLNIQFLLGDHQSREFDTIFFLMDL